MEFNKHKHRNQTNRNLIIIAVGFLATVLAGAYVFQGYVSKLNTMKYKKVYIEIESNVSTDSLQYTLDISPDTTLTNFIVQGKQQIEIPVSGKSGKLVSFSLSGDENKYSDSLYVRDTVAYTFIIIKSVNDSLYVDLNTSN